MKRFLALLLCLALFLPVLASAEMEEEEIDQEDLFDDEDIDFDLDENGDLILPEEEEENYFDESAYTSSGTNGHFTVDQLERNSCLPEEDVVNILLIGVDSRPDSRSKNFHRYRFRHAEDYLHLARYPGADSLSQRCPILGRPNQRSLRNRLQ